MSARYRLSPVGVYDTQTQRIVRRQDHEWHEYLAWVQAGGTPDPQTPAAPEPERQFDPVIAGREREARKLAALAKTDPLGAALVASGITTRRYP